MSTATIGPNDEGRQVAVHVGDTVVLKLPENPTTGLRWQPDSLPSHVRLVRDTYENVLDGDIGAESIRVFEFCVDTVDVFNLQLRRMQAWEGDKSTDSEFSVTLLIKARE